MFDSWDRASAAYDAYAAALKAQKGKRKQRNNLIDQFVARVRLATQTDSMRATSGAKTGSTPASADQALDRAKNDLAEQNVRYRAAGGSFEVRPAARRPSQWVRRANGAATRLRSAMAEWGIVVSPADQEESAELAKPNMPIVPDGEETHHADRTELGARLLRHSEQVVAVREDLQPQLLRAVGFLMKRGTPVSQVKMMRACSNVVNPEMIREIRAPLRSPIVWVREQALLLLGASRIGRAANLAVELAYELARLGLSRRAGAFARAIAKSRRKSLWVLWALALFCQYGILLTDLAIPLELVNVYSLLAPSVSHAKMAAASILAANIRDGTLIRVVIVVTWLKVAFDRPERALMYTTFAAGTAAPVTLGLALLWTGDLGGGVATIGLSFVGGLLLTVAVAAPAHLLRALWLGLYWTVSRRERDGEGRYGELLRSMADHGRYKRILRGSLPMWVFIPAAIASLRWKWLTVVLVVAGGGAAMRDLWLKRRKLINSWRSFLRKLESEVAVVTGWIRRMASDRAYRRHFLQVSWTAAWSLRRPIAAYAIFGVAYILIATVLDKMSHIQLFDVHANDLEVSRFLVVASLAVVGLLCTFYFLRSLFRMTLLLRRQPYAPGTFTPPSWKQLFTRLDVLAQEELLFRTTYQSVGLPPREFLDVMREVRTVVKGDPAASTYWQKRNELEELLRHEPEG